MRRRRLLIAALSVLALALVAAFLLWGRPGAAPIPPVVTNEAYEAWARACFERDHPGGKPLNWAIARAAVEFHSTRPMERFVLSVDGRSWGNDCSDFVDCAVDEGLGVSARFRRGARDHAIGENPWYFAAMAWDATLPIQPGDIISVRHSPWYEPTEQSCWHCGLVGPDLAVYDFVKLKRWPEARYGRNSFDWFIRHSRAQPGQVQIDRLRPQYRYRIWPIQAIHATTPPAAAPSRQRTADGPEGE